MESVLAQCAPYKLPAPDAYGLCLKQVVGSVGSVPDMEQVCGEAGEWSNDCRTAWVDVQSKAHRFGAQALLEACGPAADCALQQLDGSPNPDVLAQLDRCDKYAGKYARDCAGHALQRWAVLRPDAAEVHRVVAQPTRFSLEVGTFLGMIVACQGTVGCPEGTGILEHACGEGVHSYGRDPEKCGRGAKESPMAAGSVP